jgi:hypothetical protein
VRATWRCSGADAEQVFPAYAKYGYYVECINFKENGAAQPGGNDYSGCPITDTLRVRMVQTQAEEHGTCGAFKASLLDVGLTSDGRSLAVEPLARSPSS